MRMYYLINHDWEIADGDSADASPPRLDAGTVRNVDLPHVWNADDPLREGLKVYSRSIVWDELGVNKTAFIEFAGVSGRARVWLNGTFLGGHKGGYSLFRFDISHAIRSGLNQLIVSADNRRNGEICPIGGDFNNYGGICRDVRLIVVDSTHFDLMHYGTNGLDLIPDDSGEIRVRARIAGTEQCPEGKVEYAVFDGARQVSFYSSSLEEPEVVLTVPAPRLWRGKEDPHLYRCRARIMNKEQIVDEVSLPFGFRRISLSPDTGFLLNGQRIRIHGVAKHQDWFGKGCAPSNEQLDIDMELIRDIGANAVRLSHYQHPEYMYDLCDAEGMIVWAEIPMLNMPEGNESLLQNAEEQLMELILQCKHHPSICFWGLQNEIALSGETAFMYSGLARLNALAKKLDSSRVTAGANLYTVKNKSPLNTLTDMIGYNIYFGWYYGEIPEFGSFLDTFHSANPDISLGVSEYGVDANVALHAAGPKRKDYSEEFQTLYHESVYPMIRDRRFLWGGFVWNLFDFGSANRKEGKLPGLNGKGLVTYDRAIRKDAFYYYKAQWSDDPFVHICSRRFAKRHEERIDIKVFSNQRTAALIVNGVEFGELTGAFVFLFRNVPLAPGENVIEALSGKCRDEIVLLKQKEPEASYIYIDPNPGFNVRNWFTPEEGEDELFPEDRYSIMDSIADLRINPEIWGMLEREIPDITGNPRTMAMPGISLFRVFNFMSNRFSEEFVKDINGKLRSFKKEKTHDRIHRRK